MGNSRYKFLIKIVNFIVKRMFGKEILLKFNSLKSESCN